MLGTALPEMKVMAELAKHDVGVGYEGDGKYGWSCPEITCWESGTDYTDEDAAYEGARQHILYVLGILMHEHGVTGINIEI